MYPYVHSHTLRTWVLSLAIALLFTADTWAQSGVQVDRRQLLSTSLPLVEIESVDGEMPTCDYVTHPEGAMGESITNTTKVPGRVTISVRDALLYDSGPYVQKESGMTFRIRGNTSAYLERKPYKIKLQKKADLLSRDDPQRYADKNWLLIPTGPWMDLMVAFRLSQLMGFEWTPAMKYVNVIINGNFQGVYALVEQVRRNERCRINVDKTTGYIIERDPYWWNEDVYFTTSEYRKEYTFKYPEEEDITQEQIDNVSGLVRQMEQSITAGTYDEYIDVPSWATWLLAHDILGTWDSGGSNIFLAKYDDNPASLFKMVCLWDLDSMTKMKDAWAHIHTDFFFYFPQLLSSSNPAFLQAYLDKWSAVSPMLFEDMESYLDSISHSDLGASISAMKAIEEQAFHYQGSTFEQDIADLRNWFTTRQRWLSQQMSILQTPVAPLEASPSSPSSSTTFYDLSGRRVFLHSRDASSHYGLVPPSRALLLQPNGKKIIQGR